MAKIRLSSGNGNYMLYAFITQKSQNIANNTSVVRRYVYIEKTGGSGFTGGYTSSWSLVFNGTTTSGTIASYNFTNSTIRVLLDDEITINHNATTGAFSSTYYATFTDGGNNAGIGSGTTNTETFTATTIPRASTIKTFNNFTIGDNVAWEVERKINTYTHTVELLIGSTVITSVSKSSSVSGSLTISNAMKEQMITLTPNGSKATATLRVTTFNGNTQIGSAVTKNAEATVPTDIVPTFTSVTLSEQNSLLNNIGYVQNQSSIKFTFVGASGNLGSTIKSYRIQLGNVIAVGNNAIVTPSASGTLSYTCTVIDTRDREFSRTGTISVKAYETPSIVSVEYKRALNDGTPNPNGTCLLVVAKVKVTSLVNTTERNSGLITIKSKRQQDSSYTTLPTQTTSVGETTHTLLFINHYAEFAYNVTITISDLLSSSVSVGVLAKGVVLQHWGNDATAFGTMLQDENYNILAGSKGINNLGKYHESGIQMVDYPIELGANYTKWKNGKLECWGQIAHTTGITTAIGSGFRATTPSVSFPVSFTSEPYLTATGFNHVSTSINGISTSSFALNLYSPDSGRVVGKINWHAVGNWK